REAGVARVVSRAIMDCVNESLIRSRRRGGLGGQSTISYRTIAILASVSNFAFAASLRSQELHIEALRTEYQQTPIGLDVRVPRMSWRMQAVRRGTMQ